MAVTIFEGICLILKRNQEIVRALPPHLLPNLPNRGWRVGEEGWGEGIPFNFNTEIKKKLKESHQPTPYLVGSGRVDPGHLPNRGWSGALNKNSYAFTIKIKENPMVYRVCPRPTK